MHGDGWMKLNIGKLEIIQIEITHRRGIDTHKDERRRQGLHHLTTIGVEDELKPCLGVVLNHWRGD